MGLLLATKRDALGLAMQRHTAYGWRLVAVEISQHGRHGCAQVVLQSRVRLPAERGKEPFCEVDRASPS